MTVDELIDGWEEAWSGKDPDAFADVCAAGIQYEDPLTPSPISGLDELGEFAARLWAGFPDARLERTGARLADDQFVAAPCKLLGTNREPLEGLPATNRFVVVHCIFYCELQHELLLRVRGNTPVERRIMERRREFDHLIGGVMRNAQRQLDLRADVEPRLATRLLFGMLNSITEWYRPGGGLDAPEVAEAIFRMAFEGLARRTQKNRNSSPQRL